MDEIEEKRIKEVLKEFNISTKEELERILKPLKQLDSKDGVECPYCGQKRNPKTKCCKDWAIVLKIDKMMKKISDGMGLKWNGVKWTKTKN